MKLAKVPYDLVELAKVPCELVELAKVPCELVELAKVPWERAQAELVKVPVDSKEPKMEQRFLVLMMVRKSERFAVLDGGTCEGSA